MYKSEKKRRKQTLAIILCFTVLFVCVDVCTCICVFVSHLFISILRNANTNNQRITKNKKNKEENRKQKSVFDDLI